MISSQNTNIKVLAKPPQAKARDLLEWLVNWPPEPRDTFSFSEFRRLHERGEVPAASPDFRHDRALWQTRARQMTKASWPDLWRDETQALMLLRMEQGYLQKFWGTQDPHARDWYIHRARELFYRHQIQSKFSVLRGELIAASTAEEARRLYAQINIEMEEALDQPPLRTPFEDSLFYLQDVADWVRTCQNPGCANTRYFIAEDKRRKYCTEECSWVADKKAKKESRDRHPQWEENRQAKRRSERKKAK